MCGCEFDVDPDSDDENTPETTWHYKRTCAYCGGTWWGLHCPHDGIQNPCQHCKKKPETVPTRLSNSAKRGKAFTNT